jgi:peptidoglycan hydrolase CwlO-like protein
MTRSSIVKWVFGGVVGTAIVLTLVLGSIRVSTLSRDMNDLRKEWYSEEVSRIDSMVMMLEQEKADLEQQVEKLEARVDTIDAGRAKAKGEVKSIEDWFKNRKR